jgi:hypothetical protein
MFSVCFSGVFLLFASWLRSKKIIKGPIESIDPIAQSPLKPKTTLSLRRRSSDFRRPKVRITKRRIGQLRLLSIIKSSPGTAKARLNGRGRKVCHFIDKRIAGPRLFFAGCGTRIGWRGWIGSIGLDTTAGRAPSCALRSVGVAGPLSKRAPSGTAFAAARRHRLVGRRLHACIAGCAGQLAAAIAPSTTPWPAGIWRGNRGVAAIRAAR